MTEQKARPCPICGATDRNHRTSDHFFTIGSEHKEGVKLVLIVDLQRYYDSESDKATVLSLALGEIAKYFPQKRFMLIPSRMMTLRGEQRYNETHVASYLAYET